MLVTKHDIGKNMLCTSVRPMHFWTNEETHVYVRFICLLIVRENPNTSKLKVGIKPASTASYSYSLLS